MGGGDGWVAAFETSTGTGGGVNTGAPVRLLSIVAVGRVTAGSSVVRVASEKVEPTTVVTKLTSVVHEE